jgi:light-regulated signal transduction histidine kinase (bacteriophytochrome)
MNLLLSTYEASTRRNQELLRMKDALRDANATLEGTNRELEAFSYSVSHDLRVPLRAIQGFSEGLLDCDPATVQGDRGRELLTRIQQACQRMQQLIEDLLTLSRIARGDVRKESVNLSVLVETVAQELQRQHPERSIRLQIAQGVFAECDARLVRIALENLLGNAWKFTSKHPEASIEFGRESRGGRNSYFIRDNGAGFDMAFADKLFGAFQRLHNASEFPGTGIGLATVQRIIHRHGGRIWAESAPGAGATFHFSI